ncbi:MAG: MFS transporter, partial [Candidatus Competibacteraceae bacterium]|nr:MFS transporter [Candidatus Competibacteraceae bacterium]
SWSIAGRRHCESITGATILCLSVMVAATGIDLLNFSIALALLGVGWNLMYVAGTTMIAAAHRPEERGRVQGAAEMAIAGIATLAAFATGGLLNGLGWLAVNISSVPLLIAAAGITYWFKKCVPAKMPNQTLSVATALRERDKKSVTI